MRHLSGVMGLLAALTLATAVPAEALQKLRAKPAPKAKALAERQVSLLRATPAETYDDVRANSQDPAGNYKGFPSWARSAFTNQARD